MKSLIKTVVLFVSLLNVAYAQGMYFGASYSQTDYDEIGFQKVQPTVLTFKVGNQFNPHFAIEGRAGFGFSGDSITVGGGIPVTLTLEIDNYYGLYGRGILPVSEVFSFYGLVGLTRAKLTSTASGGGITIAGSGTDSSPSYGVGLEALIDKNTSINLEWANLLDEEVYDLDALSVGVNFKF